MDILGFEISAYGWQTVAGSAISGVFLGSIYALVALGLTLIYGVLHIINFAHGSLLMLAMYAVFFVWAGLGIDPYLAMLLVGRVRSGCHLHRLSRASGPCRVTADHACPVVIHDTHRYR
jgi:hypothetical protein